MADLLDSATSVALPGLLTTLVYPAEMIACKVRSIYESVLAASPHLKIGNFQSIAATDLEMLFEGYDAAFFQGLLRQTLRQGNTPLRFRVAPRMTRAGGKTFRYQRRLPHQAHFQIDYEIAISSTLLFQSFEDVTRTVRINGLECADRLEALQRIMEHEMLHLAELLVWGKSSCAAANFQTLARHVFGHTAWKHDLVTQHERACTNFQIHVGNRVAFEFEGRRQEGIVNRIVRRATVLVEDPTGLPYSNGKRYLKFYIPVEMLAKVGDNERSGN